MAQRTRKLLIPLRAPLPATFKDIADGVALELGLNVSRIHPIEGGVVALLEGKDEAQSGASFDRAIKSFAEKLPRAFESHLEPTDVFKDARKWYKWGPWPVRLFLGLVVAPTALLVLVWTQLTPNQRDRADAWLRSQYSSSATQPTTSSPAPTPAGQPAPADQVRAEPVLIASPASMKLTPDPQPLTLRTTGAQSVRWEVVDNGCWRVDRSRGELAAGAQVVILVGFEPPATTLSKCQEMLIAYHAGEGREGTLRVLIDSSAAVPSVTAPTTRPERAEGDGPSAAPPQVATPGVRVSEPARASASVLHSASSAPTDRPKPSAPRSGDGSTSGDSSAVPRAPSRGSSPASVEPREEPSMLASLRVLLEHRLRGDGEVTIDIDDKRIATLPVEACHSRKPAQMVLEPVPVSTGVHRVRVCVTSASLTSGSPLCSEKPFTFIGGRDATLRAEHGKMIIGRDWLVFTIE